MMRETATTSYAANGEDISVERLGKVGLRHVLFKQVLFFCFSF